jgi:signal transduction histidine kinase
VFFKLHASETDGRLDVGMPVEISDVLHVLAHELRTPSGIAQGYLRMLLEERLADPKDRRQALEQTQKALARMSELTHESSRLAGWFERPAGAPTETIDAKMLIDRVVEEASADAVVTSRIDANGAQGAVRTPDVHALVTALTTVAKATARELRNQPCTIAARAHEQSAIDVLIGADDHLAALGSGPGAAEAGPLGLERGGLGLSLVYAVAVLDSHGAIAWTANGSRGTVGIRLPIEERHP